MARQAFQYSRFISGISDFPKEGVQGMYSLPSGSYYFARNIDVRSDPRSFKLLPRTLKASNTTVTDLPKWAETVGQEVYVYGNTGNFYKRSSAGAYSFLQQIPASHGNGLTYFGEDDYVYYTQDKTIGRFGPISNNPQFTSDFLGAQGGVPQNTNSVLYVSASTQYASRADSVSLSITGNLAVEAWIKPTTLPAVGSSQVILSKWTENGNARSYRFEIFGISGYFGNGGDGSLSISVDTTEAPIDSTCTGTSGAVSLSATNVSFATGQIIFIHQTQGAGAGNWQRNVIQGYTAGTITLATALNANYVSGAQVRVLKQYSSVTINSLHGYVSKAWNGSTGGIIGGLVSGTLTVAGVIQASSSGFVGGNNGASSGNNSTGQQGEGTSGTGSYTTSANGNGGGGSAVRAVNEQGNNGAGGGNGVAGDNGTYSTGGTGSLGAGGATSGSADLTTMTFGGGGGGGGFGDSDPGSGGNGGAGGGIIFFSAVTINVTTGSITAAGAVGQDANGDRGAGGGGAGGSILLKAQTAALGGGQVVSPGGAGGNWSAGQAGNGGAGRVHLDYLTSYTGTSTPTLDALQDGTLVTTASYQLRLGISSNGTNNEFLAKTVMLSTGSWQQVAVSWTASTSTATFFLNAVSQGTSTGTLTSISDNASVFSIARYLDGSSATAGLFNGGMDEIRLWSTTKTATDILANLNTQIAVNSPNLNAYYKMNGNANDSTGNTNNLTDSGSPTYPTDVPFPSPSTRLDIDQQATTTGHTYTTPTSIDEGATNRLTFTPQKDPQKSIGFLIAAVGTGNWTVTIHDSLNRTIASVTVANASLSTGYYEFVFASVWRPIINNTYHAHITSTVADGTVTTGTADDLETVSYRTYFQILVSDTDFHPAARMLNFIVFGNERYVGTWSALTYEPNQITLPATYRVRCFGYWREYLVIGTWRGTTITDFDEGRLYFWDGVSDTFNFYIDVPEGGINAVLGIKGRLFVWAGYQGDLLVYEGADSAEKIKRVPYITPSTYVEIFPGAVTSWKTLTRFGVAGNTNSTTINQAVYTFGSANKSYADALTCDYTLSTGNYGSTIKIGMLGTVGGKLLIGWQDGVGFGIDEVTSSNNPYPTGTILFNLEDGGAVWKQKLLLSTVADFSTLNAGEDVVLKFATERSSSFTSMAANDDPSTGSIVSTYPTGGGRFKELQISVDLSTSTTTSPVVYDVVGEYDDLTAEKKVGGLG